MTIEYSFGNEISEVEWTGLLEVGDEQVVLIEDVSLALGQNEVTIALTKPNDVDDGDSSDNSISQSFSIDANGTSVTMSLITDCYASETSWKIEDQNGIVVHQRSPGELDNLTTYVYEMCLPAGCYFLEIADTYGDGLAGSESNCEMDGDYFVLVENEEVVTMNLANFEDEVIHEFCVGVNSEISWSDIPENAIVNCESNYNPDELGWASASSLCDVGSVEVQYEDVLASNSVIRTWTAIDGCDNVISYSQVIELIDEESPELICEEDVIVSSEFGQQFVEVEGPEVSDNCSFSTLINSYNGSEDASDNYFLGTTLLTWVGIDSQGNQGTCTQAIVVNDSIVSGIESSQILSETGMVLYPNPNFGDDLNIQLAKRLSDEATISVIDPTGRVILGQRIEVSTVGNLNLQLPVDMATGVYFVQLRSDEYSVTEKFILKRKRDNYWI